MLQKVDNSAQVDPLYPFQEYLRQRVAVRLDKRGNVGLEHLNVQIFPLAGELELPDWRKILDRAQRFLTNPRIRCPDRAEIPESKLQAAIYSRPQIGQNPSEILWSELVVDL